MNKNEWEIRWTNALSVGVPELDQEHRRFVARVNQLNHAILESEDKPAVERLLDLMLMEAAHHFWHEQRLMVQWKYPERAVHAAKHARLTEELDRVMRDFEQADVSFTWAAKGLHIKQLLVDHLLKEDMKYRDFLQQNHDASPPQHKRPEKRKLELVSA